MKNLSKVIMIIFICLFCIAVIIEGFIIFKINSNEASLKDKLNAQIEDLQQTVREQQQIIAELEAQKGINSGEKNNKSDLETQKETISDEQENNSDYVLLYNGNPIEKTIGKQSVNDDEVGIYKSDLDKYNKTLYSYHSDGYMKVIDNPQFVQSLFFEKEDYYKVSNVSTFAVSKNYDLMPREMKYDYVVTDESGELQEFEKNIRAYYSNITKYGVWQPDCFQVDLNGDGELVYIRMSATKEEDYPGIMLNYDAFDKNGNHICKLLSNGIYVLEASLNDYYVESLKDMNRVFCLDVDNDSKMELVIAAIGYEFDTNLFIYKYENGEFKGDVGARYIVLP